MDIVYQYHTQSPVINPSGINCFIMNSRAHRFIADYASKFADVRIPKEIHDPVRLSLQETRRIGKAMVTHERAEKPMFSKNQDPDGIVSARIGSNHLALDHRFEIVREMEYGLTLNEIQSLWRITPLFLLGGECEIKRKNRQHHIQTLAQEHSHMLPSHIAHIITMNRH